MKSFTLGISTFVMVSFACMSGQTPNLIPQAHARQVCCAVVLGSGGAPVAGIPLQILAKGNPGAAAGSSPETAVSITTGRSELQTSKDAVGNDKAGMESRSPVKQNKLKADGKADSPESAEPLPDQQIGMGDLASLKWVGEAQKARCEANSKELKERFLDARYYSIQGDSCATASHAQSFLKLAETCRKECPEGFLEMLGYNQRIIRNLEWLHKLGTEQCFK